MTPDNRKRLGLVLIVLLFAAPILTAYLLNAFGWRPAGMRNYGTLVKPPQNLGDARFILDDGKPLAWEDDEWSWTLIALTGPECAERCLAHLDELRRARLTLNQNARRVRLVVLGAKLSDAALEPLKPLARAHDADEKLASYRPAKADEVSLVLVDPHGFLILSYPAGYDANLMRRDLARLVKG
jgi:hypothetical protein